MDVLKQLMLASGTVALQASRIISRTSPAATALLSHRYLLDGESRNQSLDRLRRQLDWIQRAFKPIGVPELINGLVKGIIVDGSLVITTDDAHLDVFEVSEEFRSFGIPLAMFVPVGWVASQETSESGALIETVTAVQWYEGPDVRIDFGVGLRCDLSPSRKAPNIDWILNERDSLAPHLDELCFKIASLKGSHRQRHARRSTCSWSELQKLAASGVYIGPHSVSHVPISQMSPVRRKFEIIESKCAIEAKIGPCTSFAYPYGTLNTYDDITQTELKSAGFQAAFLTHSDIITTSSPFYELPRITIPDVPMSLGEFKARVQGGGILLQRLRGRAANT